MDKLSVIIPARNEIFLQNTIDSVLSAAVEDIEVLAVCDGYSPDPALREDPRLTVIHNPESIGQRQSINLAAERANGKYIMKLDAHCALALGFDKVLKEDCKPEWTMVPTMYTLDVLNWQPKMNKRTDYMYISSPDHKNDGKDYGFRAMYYGHYAGASAKRPRSDRLIDETMCCMGPGWFMWKDRFWEQGGCDTGHGGWGQQGVEVALKAWLSGGALMVNKKTWFAHWFRGGEQPAGLKKGFPYRITYRDQKAAREYSQSLWLQNKWEKQARSIEWLVDKFKPPTWQLNGVASNMGKTIQTTALRLDPYKQKRNIIGRSCNISLLDNSFTSFCPDNKRRHLLQFRECFAEFLGLVKAEKLSDDELRKSNYYAYQMARRVDNERWTERGDRIVLRKLRQHADIYNDIKQHGLAIPIDMVSAGDRHILMRGFKRVYILKDLGKDSIPCRVFKNMDAYVSLQPSTAIDRADSIHGLAQNQFSRLGCNATDKYWVHGYTQLYDKHIGYMRPSAKAILELGVANGASLALWERAFPNAAIYGLDKDQLEAPVEPLSERVKVFVAAQDDRPFIEQNLFQHGPFDIIIDDCSHDPKRTIRSFDILFPQVTKGGWYVVEDTSGRQTTIDHIKSLVDTINNDRAIKTVSFHYNICFVQKN